MAARLSLIIFFCFLSLGIFVNGGSLSKRRIAPRIIGGQPATAGQFKFIAAINIQTSDSRFFCGGALVSSQYVLTSGHCAYNAVLFTIQLGSHHLNGDDPNRVTLSTSTYHIHPDFDPQTIDNDIALIQLRMPVTYTDYIQPIHVSQFNHQVTDSITLGFGQVSDSDPELSEQLMYVDVTTITNEECRIFYGNQITDSMVCVAGNYNEGTCTGDNGAPLIYGHSAHYNLIAVGSFISGNGCEGTDPSGYTRTFPYLDWIANITADAIDDEGLI